MGAHCLCTYLMKAILFATMNKSAKISICRFFCGHGFRYIFKRMIIGLYVKTKPTVAVKLPNCIIFHSHQQWVSSSCCTSSPVDHFFIAITKVSLSNQRLFRIFHVIFLEVLVLNFIFVYDSLWVNFCKRCKVSV